MWQEVAAMSESQPNGLTLDHQFVYIFLKTFLNNVFFLLLTLLMGLSECNKKKFNI